MYKVNEEIEVKVLLLDDNGNPVNGTIAYVVYDEADVSYATGNMVQIGAVTGFYTMAFTPDTIGEWTVFLSCASPQRGAVKTFTVGKGIEKDNYDLLTNATYGLAALETLVDDLESRLTDARAGYLDNLNIGGNVASASGITAILSAIALLNDLSQSDVLSDATPFAGADIADILADTNELQSDLKDGGRLDLLIDSIKSKTDTIPRMVCHMDFWSENDDEIVLTTTATDDHNLPNVVVAGLPTGITIIRVVALLKVALIKDASGSDNAINDATALKVDSSSLYDSLVTAIDIPDNSWAVDVSEATERGGDVMIGDNDVKTEVTVNGTYYGQLTDIRCDVNNLKLKDVSWGLRVYFTV